MPQPTDVSTQWHEITDSAGRHFQILPQQHWQSCFAACLCMAFLLVKGRRPPEALGRLATGFAGRGGTDDHHATWDDRGSPFVVQAASVRQMGMGVDVTRPTASALTFNCSPGKPGIAAVHWNGGGAHSVLCLGAVPRTTRVLFLDPWFGIQEIEHADLPHYHAVDVWRNSGESNAGLYQGDLLLCKA